MSIDTAEAEAAEENKEAPQASGGDVSSGSSSSSAQLLAKLWQIWLWRGKRGLIWRRFHRAVLLYRRMMPPAARRKSCVIRLGNKAWLFWRCCEFILNGIKPHCQRQEPRIARIKRHRAKGDALKCAAIKITKHHMCCFLAQPARPNRSWTAIARWVNNTIDTREG